MKSIMIIALSVMGFEISWSVHCTPLSRIGLVLTLLDARCNTAHIGTVGVPYMAIGCCCTLLNMNFTVGRCWRCWILDATVGFSFLLMHRLWEGNLLWSLKDSCILYLGHRSSQPSTSWLLRIERSLPYRLVVCETCQSGNLWPAISTFPSLHGARAWIPCLGALHVRNLARSTMPQSGLYRESISWSCSRVTLWVARSAGSIYHNKISSTKTSADNLHIQMHTG